MTGAALGVRLMTVVLRAYQRAISPVLQLLGVHCRFQPTCSQYALEALAKHGALQGGLRTIGRLLRCHPLHPGGFDPP